MEVEINTNYAGEIIPDPLELLQEIEQLTKSISELPQYGFLELFAEVERKGNVEYHRNNSIWQERIAYNTWDKNVSEELEKDEGERRKKNDVKGLYIFYEDNKPIYIGISRAILRRLKHHFLGKIHNEATLVYLMLRHKHDTILGLYTGERANLALFQNERMFLQNKIRTNWRIAIIPETDNYKMYFFFRAAVIKLKIDNINYLLTLHKNKL